MPSKNVPIYENLAKLGAIDVEHFKAEVQEAVRIGISPLTTELPQSIKANVVQGVDTKVKDALQTSQDEIQQIVQERAKSGIAEALSEIDLPAQVKAQVEELRLPDRIKDGVISGVISQFKSEIEPILDALATAKLTELREEVSTIRDKIAIYFSGGEKFDDFVANFTTRMTNAKPEEVETVFRLVQSFKGKTKT